MGFLDKLQAAMVATDSRLCVGLDPTLEQVPAHLDRSPAGLLTFTRAVIEATAPHACSYKINPWFYIAWAGTGMAVLEDVCRAVHQTGRPLIVDGKCGDVPHVAIAQAALAYDVLGADAVTATPYVGPDGLRPLLRAQGYVFVVCRTSNPRAWVLQDVDVGGAELYITVARHVVHTYETHECGLVAAASDPYGLRRIAPHLMGHWLLLPGLGAQGPAQQDLALGAGMEALHTQAEHAIWTLSRSITQAGRDYDRDYVSYIAAAARSWKRRLNAALRFSYGNPLPHDDSPEEPSHDAPAP